MNKTRFNSERLWEWQISSQQITSALKIRTLFFWDTFRRLGKNNRNVFWLQPSFPSVPETIYDSPQTPSVHRSPCLWRLWILSFISFTVRLKLCVGFHIRRSLRMELSMSAVLGCASREMDGLLSSSRRGSQHTPGASVSSTVTLHFCKISSRYNTIQCQIPQSTLSSVFLA